MVLNAGELRHTATFRTPTVATADGDTTLDPRIDDFDVRVAIKPVGGTEETLADQVQAARYSLVTMRYDSRVNERMQLISRRRTFEILSILNVDEQDRVMQLTCRELV